MEDFIRWNEESMTSSGVGPEQDPLERYYRVEELERIRREEEKKGKRPPPRGLSEPNPGWSAFILFLFDKLFTYLRQSVWKGMESGSLKSARETLLLIKASFEIMMQEDRSQDAQFLKQLSKRWQEVLELSIEFSQTAWSKQLKRFIKDIERYPENEEHTFGYYLDEFAGQSWLPFPYMELIQKLHHQHELDPPSSLLTRWTTMIEEILNSG